MNIIRHPSLDGWLIGTPEVTKLIDTDWKIAQPDSTAVHPLHFTPPDFLDSDLEAVKIWGVDAVNQWAGQQRRQHFTDITAQDSVYADKEAEARRCLVDASPTSAGYPYCEIERGIIEAAMGQPVDLHTAAGFIVQVADEKRALSVAIEAKRRGVGAQVAAAQTVAEIEAALAELV